MRRILKKQKVNQTWRNKKKVYHYEPQHKHHEQRIAEVPHSASKVDQVAE